VVLGADLIAGFPTETEAMFANTLAAVDDLGLTFLHVFPFSPRPSTPAARMPQVPAATRKARAARLRRAGDAAQKRDFTARVGTDTDVLVEDGRTGRTPHYAPLRMDADAAPGAVVAVRVTGTRDDHLIGTAVS